METGQGRPGKRDAPGRRPRDQRLGRTRHQWSAATWPTWHTCSRGIEPTVQVGWPSATARGPEAILNDPEAKLLLRQATESHRKKPPAQEWSPGTQDVYCPSWPP